MILDNISSFLDTIFQKINEKGIDVSDYELDHIGYQASSNEDYDKTKPQFLEIGELVSEEIVGGRRVGIVKLNTPITYQNRIIPAVEFAAPKDGQNCPSAWEHVELVIKESFDDFIKRYPNLDWDTSAVNQPMFPMVKLRLTDALQVKFHYQPVLEIIKDKTQ